jgi:hypothetical protein
MQVAGAKEGAMSKFGSLLAVALIVPAVAAAQGAKMSGSLVCSPPSNTHALPVEGLPNHAYSVAQVMCSWTKPWQIAGVAAKDGVATGSDAISAGLSNASGTFVDTMANGDKAIYKYSFKSVLKDGKVEKITDHRWELIGGTGKMQTLKGKGTCAATPEADGKVNYECQGEYK